MIYGWIGCIVIAAVLCAVIDIYITKISEKGHDDEFFKW